MNQVARFKRDGDGLTIDVKVERMSDKPWTWRRLVQVACALADITR
jgi:hypothetical protein